MFVTVIEVLEKSKIFFSLLFGLWTYVKNISDQKTDKENQKKENDIEEIKMNAAILFEHAAEYDDYEESFNLFKEVHESKPNDVTGYTLFLNRAREIKAKRREEERTQICTPLVKKLLNHAIQLSNNPKAAKNELEDCD